MSGAKGVGELSRGHPHPRWGMRLSVYRPLNGALQALARHGQKFARLSYLRAQDGPIRVHPEQGLGLVGLAFAGNVGWHRGNTANPLDVADFLGPGAASFGLLARGHRPLALLLLAGIGQP
ncbi:MAG: hypothetical protein AAF449_17520 [Myxococcota bacterium]